MVMSLFIDIDFESTDRRMSADFSLPYFHGKATRYFFFTSSNLIDSWRSLMVSRFS